MHICGKPHRFAHRVDKLKYCEGYICTDVLTHPTERAMIMCEYSMRVHAWLGAITMNSMGLLCCWDCI